MINLYSGDSDVMKPQDRVIIVVFTGKFYRLLLPTVNIKNNVRVWIIQKR